MSIFLMGVWDPATRQWCTVAKCGNGHNDKTIEQLNKQLKMKKISKVCILNKMGYLLIFLNTTHWVNHYHWLAFSIHSSWNQVQHIRVRDIGVQVRLFKPSAPACI